MTASKAANKTVETDASVRKFIDAVADERRQQDSLEMIEILRSITGCEPRLWGSSLVGFGRYHYRYESGREGDSFLTGFSPRKAAFTVYVMPGFQRYGSLLKKLGPHKTGKSCLYLKNLDAVDREVLTEILRESVAYMRANYPTD